ncbi:MAG: glycosyl transferase family 2 [Bacteroidetes bacterium MedPE-SWsnd-G2]|nr:MAG: glycosyl transferase family 2 [Bacteroidetes bacterium MedPE-SWsnd-G2]
MANIEYSFIVPVFNRPKEIEELLLSFTKFESNIPFEIVIVEDGSNITSKSIVKAFNSQLHISYFFKPNSGPGDSRNYGMQKAEGNYFIILDSDVIMPPNYLEEVNAYLSRNYVDCFGGPDAAHASFTNLQKAINFAMTSFITTGGIRGGNPKDKSFQPRSFNMGLSKDAFIKTGGFGRIHPGEDPDLSIRLVNLGFKTTLISKAFVYHKRRISWSKFYIQVNKFGMVRPILNNWHPETQKITYWFPSVFVMGFAIALLLKILGYDFGLLLYSVYFGVAFLLALIQSKNLIVAFMALPAICIQFLGYGIGFLKSNWQINVLKKNPEKSFPQLFFKV